MKNYVGREYQQDEYTIRGIVCQGIFFQERIWNEKETRGKESRDVGVPH